MPRMYKVPGQWTTDADVLPSPTTLAKLAGAAGSPRTTVERNRDILGEGVRESGADPEEQDAYRLLAEIAARKTSMEGEQSRLASLFRRLDNLYYAEDYDIPGGADHWPEGRRAGRAHVSVNNAHIYVDIPASLQAVPPVENVVPAEADDDERDAAARVERLYFAWKDDDDFELKTHEACVVKALYGHTYAKVFWDEANDRPTITIIEQPEKFYPGWGSSDYDRLDWGLYCYGLSPEAIEQDFGLKVAAAKGLNGKYFPYVVGDHADPLHQLSSSPEFRRREAPDLDLVEVYDYWYKKPRGKGKKPEIWNAIFVGNQFVRHKKHPEYDDIPYIPLPNTFIPGSPYGRPEIYDLEQLIREKDERLTAAAQMIDTITNGQMWQLIGPGAPDDLPANAMPKPNKVATPGPDAKLESIQPFVPQFAIEDYLKRVDVEMEVISGLNELLVGRAPGQVLGSSKAIAALIANYEARIRMKRDLLYRWRKTIWRVAAQVWERKDSEVGEIIDGRYRIEVKPPELTPRDELEVAQMAINLVNARLWSMERAMDRTGVEDPSDEKVLVRAEQTDPTLNPAAVAAQATLLSTMAALGQQGGAPAEGAPGEAQVANGARQMQRPPGGTQSLNGPENEGQTPPESMPANAPGGMLSQTMVDAQGEASGRILSQTEV